MTRLRLIHPGWEHFTGPLHTVEFVDGVSVDPVPQVQRDHLSASFDMVEYIDAENDGPKVRPSDGVISLPRVEPVVSGLDGSVQSTAERDVETRLAALEEAVAALQAAAEE